MFAVLAAVVVVQALLALLLFGTVALDRPGSLRQAIVEAHPWGRSWLRRRALDPSVTIEAHQRALAGLGAAAGDLGRADGT